MEESGALERMRTFTEAIGRVLNRYYYPALMVLFFGLSASYWLGYQMIGATVDENGLLVEVFALIPLAWFFLLLGLITGFYLIWKYRRE